MSSLTSLGVNKNTARFTPKPRRPRKPRKPKITPPLSDSEEDVKYPIILSHFHYPPPPTKVQCVYLKDPPTTPHLPQFTVNHHDKNNNKKIPIIIAAAEEEGSLPASPPEDAKECKLEPILLDERLSLNELIQRTKEEIRRSRGKGRMAKASKVLYNDRTKRGRQILNTLDDIDYDPSDEVDPESTMSEHTKDIHNGIVSHAFKQVELARRAKLGKERQNKKADKIINMVNPYRKADSPIYRRDVDTLTESVNVPQVRLVDGEIVLDVDSLVRRPVQVDHERQHREDDWEVVEENEYSRKINSATFSLRNPSAKWSELETADFYKAISQFGTDFEMISGILPGRTRHHIRNKFNKEDRINPKKISEYLINKRTLPDLQKYSALIGKELEEVPDEFMEDI
ncbi:hypothetical protein K501DRAFT_334350 [Backusella circina FSU 941]|nr:hypothetical protein K501DRAFT_334350 [Backusella circina FSU 941]